MIRIGLVMLLATTLCAVALAQPAPPPPPPPGAPPTYTKPPEGVPLPPPIPDATTDPELEPQVTIIRKETETQEEVRVNGELRYVKVTPKYGCRITSCPRATDRRTCVTTRSDPVCERRCGCCFPGELNPLLPSRRSSRPPRRLARYAPRMSVYTPVSAADLDAWLLRYAVGGLAELAPIASGIENTNYFVTTERGRYVLTLYERLPASELPFYLNLMAHSVALGLRGSRTDPRPHRSDVLAPERQAREPRRARGRRADRATRYVALREGRRGPGSPAYRFAELSRAPHQPARARLGGAPPRAP
jgi:hypothetical protein